MTTAIVLIVVGVIAGVCAVIWFLKNRSKVNSAIERSTTIPSVVTQKLDGLVPGSGSAVSSAASKIGKSVNDTINETSKAK